MSSRNEHIEVLILSISISKDFYSRHNIFGHVERRPIDVVVQRVDQMEERQIRGGRGRSRNTIRETIRKEHYGVI